MLNELIYRDSKCPVCGRYHAYPLEGWWCEYCGPTLDSIALKKISSFEEKIKLLEQYFASEKTNISNLEERMKIFEQYMADEQDDIDHMNINSADEEIHFF